eukprot:m.184734 g.184734  ORF g.184734 m.184734 type:complete len:109 (+) comp39332_c1_seq15:608-934(+)
MKAPLLLLTSVNDVDDLPIGRVSVTLGPQLMGETFNLCATTVNEKAIGKTIAMQGPQPMDYAFFLCVTDVNDLAIGRVDVTQKPQLAGEIYMIITRVNVIAVDALIIM